MQKSTVHYNGIVLNHLEKKSHNHHNQFMKKNAMKLCIDAINEHADINILPYAEIGASLQQ